MTDATPDARAQSALDAMVANGAIIHPQRRDDGLRSFTYEIDSGGDRRRSREIVRAAKEDTAVWSTLVDEIEQATREIA